MSPIKMSSNNDIAPLPINDLYPRRDPFGLRSFPSCLI